MQHIRIISLVIIVMLFIFTRASSASNNDDVEQPSTTQLSKDTLFDYIREKANDYITHSLLIKGNLYCNIWQDYIEFLQKHNSQPHPYAKQVYDNFLRIFEKFKKNKTNCLLAQEVNGPMEQVYTILIGLIVDANLREAWIQSLNQSNVAVRNELNSKFNEMYEQLPREIEKFSQTLKESEWQELKDVLEWQDNQYSMLHMYYKHKILTSPKVNDGNQCRDYEAQQVLAFLNLMSQKL